GNKHDSSMMWMMVICCASPFVFLLIAGRLILPGWGWLIGLGVLVMAGFHFWGMRKSHGSHMGSNVTPPTEQDGQSINPEQKDINEHKHH
ncbi:MAG: hypothetical protein AAB729_02490, partial [Patescibacteria group bacterium]